MKTEYEHVRFEQDKDAKDKRYNCFLKDGDDDLDVTFGIVYRHSGFNNRFMLEGMDIIYTQEVLDEISAFLKQLNKEKP